MMTLQPPQSFYSVSVIIRHGINKSPTVDYSVCCVDIISEPEAMCSTTTMVGNKQFTLLFSKAKKK